MKIVRGLTALLALIVLVGVGRTLVVEVWHLITVDRKVAAALSGVDQSLSLTGVTAPGVDSTVVDFGMLDQGIVVVFDPMCGPCNRNMANWIDLMVEVPDVPVIAVGFIPPDSALDYWGVLTRRTTVVQMDTATLVESFQVQSTPTLLVVRRGTLVRRFDGVVPKRSREAISRLLADT